MSRLLGLARWALVTEWRMYVGAARLLARRSDVPEGTEPVRYVGSVSLLLWVITAVSTVELVALHLIIPWETVRLVADVLGIWGVVWCLGYTGCHYVYPHLATPTALVLRPMRRRPAITVPWDAVAGVRVRERSLESGRAVQVEERVVSVAVGKRTALDLQLTRPVTLEVDGVTREVDEVRVQVDAPREVAALIRARQGGGATRRS